MVHLLVPISFLMLIVVLVVPLPPAMMDLLISANISLAAIILLTTIYMGRPLDFSVFPALLLATTLFRLVLNVASTRLILSADAESPEQATAVAGHVVEAFGNFVAGESVMVGVIIFIILVVVQFVVITKGATRMSEVAGRFTLDAMPGKQMAIDADLNAGLIDEFTVALSPVVFGTGVSLFDGTDDERVGLEIVDTVPTESVTHISYQVFDKQAGAAA